MRRKHKKPRLQVERHMPPNEPVAWSSPDMYGSLQAALPVSGGSILWPLLDEAHAIDQYDLDQVYRGARYLEHNSGIIGKAVEDIVNLQGWLMPYPRTQDEEWNDLARRAFIARTKDETLFDVAGQNGWRSMQTWMETQRCIDGDCLCVLCRAADGGACVALYDAAQIRQPGINAEGWNMGVKTDANGRPVEYAIHNWADGVTQTVPASAAILYRHHPSPTRPRGLSDLHRILVHGIDIAETNGYTKQGIKIAAMIGLIETKGPNDKQPAAATRMNNKKPAVGDNPVNNLTVEGTKMISLAPGRDIKTLTDGRPSQNALNFTKQLITEIAWGVGLEPEVLYYLQGLGSAGVRFSLEKLRRWILKRRIWREQLVNRIYRHVIACEITSGRLRMCRDAAGWKNVEWVGLRDMTIDVGREGGLAINQIREGLKDPDRWTLDTEEMPVMDILERKARILSKAQQLSADYGVSLDRLLPGSVGAQTAPEKTEDVEEKPLQDDDPEA